MSKKLQLLNQVGIKADYKDGDLSLETSGFIINPVTSVNGQTGDVTVDTPVPSVNGQTGEVNITASGIGAASTSDVEQLQSKVGDTPVSEQINSAMVDVLSIDTTDADTGTVPYTNSDLFGGKTQKSMQAQMLLVS